MHSHLKYENTTPRTHTSTHSYGLVNLKRNAAISLSPMSVNIHKTLLSDFIKQKG